VTNIQSFKIEAVQLKLKVLNETRTDWECVTKIEQRSQEWKFEVQTWHWALISLLASHHLRDYLLINLIPCREHEMRRLAGSLFGSLSMTLYQGQAVQHSAPTLTYTRQQ
jgi:hypothetical protein